jgi:DNA ligase (NAD+)
MLDPEDLDEARADELEKLISAAREDYYVKHKPKVSDATFDAWVDELRGLRPKSPQVTGVGAAVKSEWKKVAHEIPMGSLDKVNFPFEMAKWIKDNNTGELFVTEKLDGISVALRYENGVFTQGVTRGDGQEGEDITRNVAKMAGVPAKLPKDITAQFRGEIICTLSSLAKNFPEYANPRNTASGIASRLDGTGSEHLTVLVYRVAEGADNLPTRSAQLSWIRKLGFKTPNSSVTLDPEPIWEEYQKTTRDKLDYAIDGLVVEINDVAKQEAMGESSGCPNGARAFKFAAPSRESTLRQIDNQTGGAGHITPVAIFDEVNLLGTKVTRASLYNWKYIRDLKLNVGARILVARANDVIPRVTEVVEGTGSVAEPPSKCPSCGAPTDWDGEYLVCTDTADCPAQTLGRLIRYVKSLNILEWGEAVMERLVAAGMVKNVADLYRLEKLNLADIDRMGEKSAQNLLKTLWAKNPLPIESFFGALSIPGCGESMIRLIVDAGYDTVEKLLAVRTEQLMAIKGLGPVRSKTLSDWFSTHGKDVVKDTLSTGLKLKDRVRGGLTGKSFCFTGKSEHKRADLEDMVRNAGGTVKGSVGAGLTYLVMADPNSASTKAQAAKKHGTVTISESDFVKMAAG